MSVSVLAGTVQLAIAAIAPYVLTACVLNPPPVPPAPVPDETIFAPVPPGVGYESLPLIDTETQIVDTSPDQIIGCANGLAAGGEQVILDTLFPAAEAGDGVVNRSTNDIWTYDGSVWTNVGPTPGPTLTVVRILPPYNETAIYNARLRVGSSVTKFDYALELLTVVPDQGVLVGADISRILAIRPPAVPVSLSILAPIVSTGAIVRPPVIATDIVAEVPVASTGVTIAIESTNFDFAALAPDQTGVDTLRIETPSTALSVDTSQPTVVTGVSIAVPTVIVSLDALTPMAGGNLGDRFSLTVLVEDDLLSLIE